MPRALRKTSKKDRETPQWFFNKLDREFGFTLDAAADETNAKCTFFFSENTDALSITWGENEIVWLNPPYGRGRKTEDWVAKAYEESTKGTTVVMLLPASTDTYWWHNYALKYAEIRFVNGRLKFDGLPGPGWFANVVLIFRPGQDRAFLGPAISAREH